MVSQPYQTPSDNPEPTPSALEVAREFFALAKRENSRDFTTMKLQKLLYRAQCLCEHERGKELFAERVKAWKDGPVVPAVWHQMRGYKIVPYTHENLGKPAQLSDSDRELIHAVWVRYKHLSGDEMSQATHEEEAYLKARAKAGIFNRSPAIDNGDMRAEVDRDRCIQLALIEAFVSGMEADAR